MSSYKSRSHRLVALMLWVSLSTLVLGREAQSLEAPQSGRASETGAPGTQSDVKFDSPRLASLARELMAGNRDALDDFWRQMKGNAPLVELIPGSDRERWITFLWRGDEETQRVTMLGDIPTTDVSQWQLRRLADTDVWYKTERVPKDARFGYAFSLNGGRFQRDPLNPRTFAGRSVVELPDAPPQPWIIKRPDVPEGELRQQKIASEILKEERTVSVYTPPGYTPKGRPYGLLVVFDGESYGSTRNSAVPTPTLLDNLLAEGKIPPLIALLVHSQRTRNRDLVCSAPFADFLAKELVPWVRRNYDVSSDPARAILAGSSYGGLCAVYSAGRHPRVFGNVLSQSGSFTYYPGRERSVADYTTETGWLTRQFATMRRLPLRFYLEVGRFEGGPVFSLLRENRHLRDVLVARGYSVTYSEFTGGHDYLTWRNSLADGLIALTQKSRQVQRLTDAFDEEAKSLAEGPRGVRHEEGFLRRWLLLAPIAMTGGQTGEEALNEVWIENEGQLAPRAGDTIKVGDKVLTWKTVEASDFFDFFAFDVNNALGNPMENAVAYAVAYVTAPEELKELQLRVGSDDQCAVWLNGRDVIRSTEARPIGKDQNRADGVTLARGTNVIVFKVVNEIGDWAGCARFTDKDGKPVTGITLGLTPPAGK